jgi:hypothetical protein
VPAGERIRLCRGDGSLVKAIDCAQRCRDGTAITAANRRPKHLSEETGTKDDEAGVAMPEVPLNACEDALRKDDRGRQLGEEGLERRRGRVEDAASREHKGG